MKRLRTQLGQGPAVTILVVLGIIALLIWIIPRLR